MDNAAEESSPGGCCAHAVSDDGFGSILPLKSHARFVLRHHDALVVSTWSNVNDQAIVTVKRSVIDSLLNGREIAFAILRDHHVNRTEDGKRNECQ